MKTIRVIIGVAIWLTACGFAWAWWNKPSHHVSRVDSASQLWRFVAGERCEAALRLPPRARSAIRDSSNRAAATNRSAPAAGESGAPPAAASSLVVVRGEPIFVDEGMGRFRQVGEVIDAGEGANATVDSHQGGSPRVLFYPDAPPIGDIDRLTAYRTPQSMQWVIETMLPPEKRLAIAAEMTNAFERHHEEIVDSLRPMVEASLRDALVVVEEDLPGALARHQDELQAIGARYQRDLVEREIVPLVRDEVWPIVRREAEPMAVEIGHEIWQRASLWRFGWRFVYDRSPLPERQLVKKEWNRFLSDDAIPVLEDHTGDLIRIQQRILAEVARNEEVQRVVRKSVEQIVSDRELQGIVWQVVRETMVDNPRIHDVLNRHWQSAEAHAVYDRIGARLEPTVLRIGELLIGTPEEGITPEFARVLRNRILNKDERWLVVERKRAAANPAAAQADRRATESSSHELPSIPVVVGPAPLHNPFVLIGPQAR